MHTEETRISEFITTQDEQNQLSDLDSGDDGETESDFEYDSVTIPELLEQETSVSESEANEPLSLKSLEGNGKAMHLNYQRGAKAHRQTEWRKTKREEELRVAAIGSASITAMFAAQAVQRTGSEPFQALKIPTVPSVPTRALILCDAIKDLESKMGMKRKSTRDFLSLSVQTQTRHRAVLHFLYAQCGDLDARRKPTALSVAQSFNRGKAFAEQLVTWERSWVSTRVIPAGRSGIHAKVSSLLNDEDVKLFVMEFIASKKEEITSELLGRAVTEYVGSKSAGKKLQMAVAGIQCDKQTEKMPREGIRARTARLWLNQMGLTFREGRKDVYVDGHERDDVVAYREAFLARYSELEPRIAQWDEAGNLIGEDTPPAGGKWIIVVTHDESTFNVNDGRRYMWLEEHGDPLRPKGKGKGIMVSDFLTPNGRLTAPPQITDDTLAAQKLPRQATIMLEYGKDSYWTGEKMCEQTLDIAIPLFEIVFPPQKFQGLFLFDNATNHHVLAEDALTVRDLNLHPGGKQPHLRTTTNPAGETQSMNFPNGIQKGIRQILKERGKWPQAGLRIECKPVSAHNEDNTCCAKKVLAAEPDFRAQQGLIQERIEARGHLVLFYPKFHPELNFIEYYWGASKRYAREHCDYSLVGLRTTIPQALESVPNSTIAKYYKRTLRIMQAYREGSRFGSKEYQEKVYKSHRRAVSKGGQS